MNKTARDTFHTIRSNLQRHNFESQYSATNEPISAYGGENTPDEILRNKLNNTFNNTFSVGFKQHNAIKL